MGDTFFRPEPVITLQELFGLGDSELFRILAQLGTTWGVVL